MFDVSSKMKKNRDTISTVWIRFGGLILFGGVVAFGGGCASGRITADAVYFPSSGTSARVCHLKSFNRIDDVVAIEPTFVEMIRGERFASRVESPGGIAAHGNQLYICDTEQAVVHVWDLSTGHTDRLGQTGEVLLGTPVDVAVGADGTVFVADTGRGEVVVFGRDGSGPSRLRTSGGGLFRPVSVAWSLGKLLVCDLESASIVVFDVGTGSVAATFTLSDKTGDAVMPMGVAVGSAGEILVTDAMGGRVIVLSEAGELVRTMSQRGDRIGDMGHPKHLDMSDDGTVFVADAEFARVHLYNGAGELLMLLGGAGDRIGGTPMPFGVAVVDDSSALRRLVPVDFGAKYFVAVTNSLGSKRVSLFAVGEGR